MPNIDIYAGHRKKRNRHEEIVLSRVLNLLVKHATDAVIFCDIWLDDRQVDILVGTEKTTVQLEVKGWALRGPCAAKWQLGRDLPQRLGIPTGQRVPASANEQSKAAQRNGEVPW